MPEITNIIPITGRKSVLPENTVTQAINPPSASEPVSPINIPALFTLNSKNADNAPTAIKHRFAEEFPPVAKITPNTAR